MDLEDAVKIGTVLEAEKHKQMKYIVMQDWCNKNFANWSKIDEVLINFGFWCSWMSWENCDDFDLVFGENEILLWLLGD